MKFTTNEFSAKIGGISAKIGTLRNWRRRPRQTMKKILTVLLLTAVLCVYIPKISSVTVGTIADSFQQPSRKEDVHIAVTAEFSHRHPDIYEKLGNLTKSVYRQSNGGSFVFHVFTDLDSNVSSIYKEMLQHLNLRDPRIQGSARFYDVKDVVKKYKDTIQFLMYYFWERTREDLPWWASVFRIPVVFLRPLFYLMDELGNVDRIISLDSDMMLMSDIYNLNSKFYEMSESQAIALAPDFTYCDHSFKYWNEKSPDSPIGKNNYVCVNGGVLLSDLKKLRKSKSYLYRMTEKGAHELTDKYRMITALSEQDMLTLIKAEHPELFYTLDCRWNYQMNAVNFESVDKRIPCSEPAFLYHGNTRQKLPLEVYKSIENM